MFYSQFSPITGKLCCCVGKFSARMEKVNAPCLGHYFLQSNYRICMQLFPKTYLRSWDTSLNFVDDPDYDPNSGFGLLSGSMGGGLHF